MLLKIEREVCLAKYRSFPLCPYDVNTDEEVFYFPKVINGGWYNLPTISKRLFPKLLVTELVKFIYGCRFNSLIFLSDKDSPWITKLSASRTDYLPLTKAIEYFERNKLGEKFNGGIEVPITDLPEFINHYYCVTSCDASFHAGYFSDPLQSFIGCIHYGGEVQFATLNKKFDIVFSAAIAKTKFRKNNR